MRLEVGFDDTRMQRVRCYTHVRVAGVDSGGGEDIRRLAVAVSTSVAR